MRHITTLLVGGFLLGSLCLLCATARAESINMAYFQLKPHMYMDHETGCYSGAAINYFNDIARAKGDTVEWTGPLPHTRVNLALTEGLVDGTLLLFKTPEREHFLYYSASPVHLSQSIFIVRKDSNLARIESAKDIEGLTVTCSIGMLITPFIQNNLDAISLQPISGANTVEQTLKMLLLDRVDAVYGLDMEPAKVLINEFGVEDELAILPLPEPPAKVYVVFSKASPKGAELIERYADAFHDSEYRKYLEQESAKICPPH